MSLLNIGSHQGPSVVWNVLLVNDGLARVWEGCAAAIPGRLDWAQMKWASCSVEFDCSHA